MHGNNASILFLQRSDPSDRLLECRRSQCGIFSECRDEFPGVGDFGSPQRDGRAGFAFNGAFDGARLRGSVPDSNDAVCSSTENVSVVAAELATGDCLGAALQDQQFLA